MQRWARSQLSMSVKGKPTEKCDEVARTSLAAEGEIDTVLGDQGLRWEHAHEVGGGRSDP